ncbi:MAG: aminotransferase class I/II-fold pyridoxal phosphate-dependent enzyme [Acidobacteriota bacterium]|nr:aminotransferase class I/II-fold pyridoxal phosphate-dependent enzyme [Acidobacteriota bacterium]
MNLSRRNFLRVGGIGLGAAATSALPMPIAAFAQRCGEPPRTPKTAGGLSYPILLNGNENPYGPLPKVKAAMPETLALANRYPDFKYEKLVATVAKTHKVKPEQVHVSCGSTEILKMAADEFAANGARLVVPHPTFEAIAHYTEAEHGRVVQVPLRPDYSHDLPNMLKAMGSGPGLFYICNPNNPTASLTARAEIEDFIKKIPPNTYVLVDEAYHHFAVGAPGYQSFLDHPVDDERVFVARTFSKVYGMAGLRLGYAVGAVPTIKRLDTEELYDDVNCVAAHCGALALEDTAEMLQAVERINGDRAAFLAECDKRGIKYVPSYANFVLLHVGSLSREVRATMHAQGILVGRPFALLNPWLRISLGLPEEMRAFWTAWDGMKDCLGDVTKS